MCVRVSYLLICLHIHILIVLSTQKKKTIHSPPKTPKKGPCSPSHRPHLASPTPHAPPRCAGAHICGAPSRRGCWTGSVA